jgi:uncharacterized protein
MTSARCIGLVAARPQNYTEAMKWIRKSADQGAAKDQYLMGSFYRRGLGVLQSDVEAVKWYRRAADQGDVDGQLSMGEMYFNGNGVPQDYVQAQKWVNLAASGVSESD